MQRAQRGIQGDNPLTGNGLAARAQPEDFGLLAAPDPDLAAIEDRQERISKRQSELQDLIVKQLLKEKQTLTEEQQKQLFNTLRRHQNCPHGPGSGRRGPGPRRHGGAGHRRGY